MPWCLRRVGFGLVLSGDVCIHEIDRRQSLRARLADALYIGDWNTTTRGWKIPSLFISLQV